MKGAIGQRDATRFESGLQKAGFIRNILTYNLPANYIEQQNKILKAMTKKDIDAFG
jgi:zinc protease